METQHHWLPLTEYALRSGVSISTLRRKIKSNTISYKMEDGRYLIQSDELTDVKPNVGFASSDEPKEARLPESRPEAKEALSPLETIAAVKPALAPARVESLPADLRQMQEDNLLRWKALEARVSGLAKKLEFFAEQMAETKMLVKIFEEKLDHRG